MEVELNLEEDYGFFEFGSHRILLKKEHHEHFLECRRTLKEIAFGPQEETTSLILKARDLLKDK